MKFDRSRLARLQGVQRDALAGGVRAREIDPQVVAHHKADIGRGDPLAGAHGDTHGGPLAGNQFSQLAAPAVEDGDRRHFRTAGSEAAVNVRNGIRRLRPADARLDCRRASLRDNRRGARLLVPRGHVGQVPADHDARLALLDYAAPVEPQHARAQSLHICHGVRDEQDRHALAAQLVDLSHAALAEVVVPDSQRLVDQQHLRFDMDRHRKREPNQHSAGVGLDRLVDEVADLGKLLDLRAALAEFPPRQPEQGRAQPSILASGEFGMEAGAQL